MRTFFQIPKAYINLDIVACVFNPSVALVRQEVEMEDPQTLTNHFPLHTSVDNKDEILLWLFLVDNLSMSGINCNPKMEGTPRISFLLGLNQVNPLLFQTQEERHTFDLDHKAGRLAFNLSSTFCWKPIVGNSFSLPGCSHLANTSISSRTLRPTSLGFQHI